MIVNRPQIFDCLFCRATVIDGTGSPRYRADVGLSGDRIAAIGDLSAADAEERFDAGGLVLAPGFIDVHTHDDCALLTSPGMPAKVTQGVTTVITGNCGISLAPLVIQNPPPPLDAIAPDPLRSFCYPTFESYVSALQSSPAAVNAGLLVGHSTLRVAVMDDVVRPASHSEIGDMRALAREALKSGAMGFSSGLFYPTNRAAPMEEVVAILEEFSGTGAVYTTHMRDEGDGVVESLDESFETARRAGVPLVVSHHKCMGRKNFGRSKETLAHIDSARMRQQIGLDVYPYTAGSTVLLPELLEQSTRIQISWSRPHPELAGRDLAEIASDWGIPQKEAMERLMPGGGIYHMMSQSDVDRVLSYANTMIGSDGMPHDEFPHPRLWGTFSRVLGHYARDRRLFSLEEGVRRMTGLPAQQFNLQGRGIIKPGAYADLVLFDPERIEDCATYEAPTMPSSGIEAVFVNGIAVMKNARPTASRPGRVLRRLPGA